MEIALFYITMVIRVRKYFGAEKKSGLAEKNAWISCMSIMKRTWSPRISEGKKKKTIIKPR